MSERLKALLKLIRLENLFIIALTQVFIRIFIIDPIFDLYMLDHALNTFEFGLLVLSTVCIAAAGYIVNDYFDVNIDRVNRPFRVLVNKFFTKKQTFRLHLALNAVGALLALYVGWKAGNYKLGFIHIVVAGLLWFYATTYKKMFLVGNLVVAVLTAAVVMLPVFFETTLFGEQEFRVANAARIILIEVLAYGIFAFSTTLIREIVKDLQDRKGDAQYGCKTLPVVAGQKVTKGVITLLCLALIGMLGYVQQFYYLDESFMRVGYIFVAIQIPVLALIFYLIPASEDSDYARLSDLMKLIMLLGILSMPVFTFLK